MIGREKSRHCQTWLDRRTSLNENLQRKQNWIAKSTNLEENVGKIKSVFVIGAALSSEKLERCFENFRSWKNTPGKLVVTANLEAIWFEWWIEGFTLEGALWVIRARFQGNKAKKCTFFFIFPFRVSFLRRNFYCKRRNPFLLVDMTSYP